MRDARAPRAANAAEDRMTTWIGLLRAVNLAGRNRVGMADLRGLLGGLGFEGARSLLQSGNLVFQADGATGAELERTLERETERRLGVATHYMVRNAREW